MCSYDSQCYVVRGSVHTTFHCVLSINHGHKVPTGWVTFCFGCHIKPRAYCTLRLGIIRPLSLSLSHTKLIYITGCPRSVFYFSRRKTKLFKSATSSWNWNISSTFVNGTLLQEVCIRLHLLMQGTNVRLWVPAEFRPVFLNLCKIAAR